jgi:hypothetical protein
MTKPATDTRMKLAHRSSDGVAYRDFSTVDYGRGPAA